MLSPPPAPVPAETYLAAFAEVCLVRAAGDDATLRPKLEAMTALREELDGEPVIQPADRIAAAFELDEAALELLLLLAAADRDYRIWAVARSIHRDPLRTGLDCAVASPLLGRPVPQLVDAVAHLERAGLIRCGAGAEAPQAYKPYQSLFARGRVVQAICGRDGLDAALAAVVTRCSAGDTPAELILPEEVWDQARQVLRSNDSDAPVLFLHGIEGVGKRSLVLSLAHQLGAPTLVVHGYDLPYAADAFADVCRALLREAKLSEAVVLVEDADAIGDPQRARVLSSALARLGRPLALSTTGGLIQCGPRGRASVRVEIDVPGEEDRGQLWKLGFGDARVTPELLTVAARYPISPGLIQRAATTGTLLAADSAVDISHVRSAISSELAERFRGVGKRVRKHESWDDLVLPPENLDAIKELLGRVRHRKKVLEEWGFGSKLAKGLGVSALFSGEPGTGKTMVAALIAEELELELYQIDLSTLVSKYIGETEKNLARAFDAAESGHAILLFDEADSLFSKRTEVKSSVDRYANMEVNYLLQRLEQFRGIAILTTNMTTSVDDAFARRLAVRIRFEMPDVAERVKLWQRMIPEATPREPGIDFDALADRYEFSGGHIRNAVLRAAYLASDERTAVTMEHLRRSADLESWEMGKVI